MNTELLKSAHANQKEKYWVEFSDWTWLPTKKYMIIIHRKLKGKYLGSYGTFETLKLTSLLQTSTHLLTIHRCVLTEKT